MQGAQGLEAPHYGSVCQAAGSAHHLLPPEQRLSSCRAHSRPNWRHPAAQNPAPLQPALPSHGTVLPLLPAARGWDTSCPAGGHELPLHCPDGVKQKATRGNPVPAESCILSGRVEAAGVETQKRVDSVGAVTATAISWPGTCGQITGMRGSLSSPLGACPHTGPLTSKAVRLIPAPHKNIQLPAITSENDPLPSATFSL